MVKFIFSYFITEAKQSNRQDGVRAVDLPARLFDLARPGLAPPLLSEPSQLLRIYYYLWLFTDIDTDTLLNSSNKRAW